MHGTCVQFTNTQNYYCEHRFPIQKHHLSCILFLLLFRHEKNRSNIFSNSFGILLNLPEAVLSTTGGDAVGDGGGLEPGAV